MRLALLHAFVWLGALWATSPDGDCTKSADCPKGHWGAKCWMTSTTAN